MDYPQLVPRFLIEGMKKRLGLSDKGCHTQTIVFNQASHMQKRRKSKRDRNLAAIMLVGVIYNFLKTSLYTSGTDATERQQLIVSSGGCLSPSPGMPTTTYKSPTDDDIPILYYYY
jgi:hypothetical protein